jgi:hypothetical protein
MASTVQTRFEPLVAMPVAEPAVRRPVRECADCRFSEIYAEQPRALCTCADSPFVGKALFSGQPVCSACVPRSGDELALAWCTPGLKIMRSRFLSVPSRRR